MDLRQPWSSSHAAEMDNFPRSLLWDYIAIDFLWEGWARIRQEAMPFSGGVGSSLEIHICRFLHEVQFPEAHLQPPLPPTVTPIRCPAGNACPNWFASLFNIRKGRPAVESGGKSDATDRLWSARCIFTAEIKGAASLRRKRKPEHGRINVESVSSPGNA